MAVGAQGEAVRGVQQHLARRRVDRRHRPLAEDVQVFFRQAESVVPPEKRDGFLVGGRAGHQVQGNPRAVASARGDDLLDVDLKQRLSRHRPDRKHALGVVEPEPRRLPSGHEDHADLARRERLGPASPGLVGREGVLRGVEPERRRRAGPVDQLVNVLDHVARVVQRGNLSQVDRANLGRQGLALRRARDGPRTPASGPGRGGPAGPATRLSFGLLSRETPRYRFLPGSRLLRRARRFRFGGELQQYARRFVTRLVQLQVNSGTERQELNRLDPARRAGRLRDLQGGRAPERRAERHVDVGRPLAGTQSDAQPARKRLDAIGRLTASELLRDLVGGHGEGRSVRNLFREASIGPHGQNGS